MLLCTAGMNYLYLDTSSVAAPVPDPGFKPKGSVSSCRIRTFFLPRIQSRIRTLLGDLTLKFINKVSNAYIK